MLDMSLITKAIPCQNLDGTRGVTLIEHAADYHVEHSLKLVDDGIVGKWTVKLSPEYVEYPQTIYNLDELPEDLRALLAA